VDFVDDINLVAAAGGAEPDVLPKRPGILNTAIARAVDFEHVEGTAFGDFFGFRIVFRKIDARAVGGVEAFGENAGEGSLAGAARADEQVGVCDTVLFDSVGEGLADVFLADDIFKPLRAVFAGYDLIRHKKRLRCKR
jgi:hypothetical protein